MYFKITYSAIYNWKGTGTGPEQKDPSLMDSFCHLIIAHEATTGKAWVLLVDQGDDAGVATSDCVSYILPGICEQFSLETDSVRVFEVWPHHRGDPEHKYTEILISDADHSHGGDQGLPCAWRPADQPDIAIRNCGG